MEARDLGDTITLYLPQGGSGSEPYAVLQERERMGAFASQDEARRFALELAASLHAHKGVPIRMRVEQADGHWETTNAS